MEAGVSLPAAFEPLTAPARYKGAHGGRGSAKSHTFATMLLVRAMEQPGLRAVCIREVQRSLEHSVKRLLEDKIEALGLADHFRVLNTHIETPGGGVIIFQGMQHYNSDSIKSLEGYDIAWVEEAQRLSQRSLDLLRPTLRKADSELWFSWNPEHATDPVDQLLRSEDTPPDSVVVGVSHEDNPWFPDVLREELEWDRSRDPEKYAHVWGGGYIHHSEAQVFRNWRVVDFETPEDACFYLGGDFGYSVDPSVMVRCFAEERTLRIDHEAYKIGCEIDFLPFLFGGCEDRELQQRNAAAWASLPHEYKVWPGVPGAREWPSSVDASRPDTISYLQRHGFPRMKPAKKGPGSIKEGVAFLQSYDIEIHPRCRHTITEMTAYRYKRDALTGAVVPVLEDKENHVIDSLRYAVEALRRPHETNMRRASWR